VHLLYSPAPLPYPAENPKGATVPVAERSAGWVYYGDPHAERPASESTRRPRRGPALNVVMFLATCYTMTLAGAWAAGSDLSFATRNLASGLSYSICLVAILGAHEMGHYLACRYYGVDASLPYFIPSYPIPMGTFGAFIRIREPIPDRKVLFDIGVAGPLAGFVVAVPVLIYGLMTAQPVPFTGPIGSVDEPLLLTWLTALFGPELPEGSTLVLAGPIMAGYVGCMATAFNLFPIGQLDGGHICFAVSGRLHRAASLVSLFCFIALGLFVFPGWLFLATLLIMIGPKHPPLRDESRGVSRTRVLIAVAALIILVICFIPRPFLTGEM